MVVDSTGVGALPNEVRSPRPLTPSSTKSIDLS
jgi:hypothetical protein